MRIASKIWDSGWGAVLLTLYSIGTIQILTPQQHSLKLFGLLPTVMVMFIADHYSYQLTDFFAGGELKRSTEEIALITGDDHYYEGVSEHTQSRVDDFDIRAYNNNISILSGILIGGTVPFVGYAIQGISGALIGFTLTIVSIQVLTRASIEELNTLARDIVEPYKANHENQ